MPKVSAYGVRTGKVKIGDVKYPVYCSSSGRFSVLNFHDGTEPPEDVEPLANGSTSMEAAEGVARITLRKRKAKVSIPFRYHDGRKGIAYGIHGGNGDVLVKDEAGESGRLGRGYTRGFGSEQRTREAFVDDIPEERVQRFIEIGEEIEKLNAERDEIEQWYGVNLHKLVLDEIERKTATAGDS